MTHSSRPSQVCASTRLGERIRSGRPACWAAKPTTTVAAYVSATRAVMADQPANGGRCKRKRLNRLKTRPKKRSMLVRLPNSSAVQVGGSLSRCCCRLGFHGMTTTAPSAVWRVSQLSTEGLCESQHHRFPLSHGTHQYVIWRAVRTRP
jgi:hypothetical protein